MGVFSSHCVTGWDWEFLKDRIKGPRFYQHIALRFFVLNFFGGVGVGFDVLQLEGD